MPEKNKGGRPRKAQKRYHITKPALQQRRARVLEMHLAGIPPFVIARELRKTPVFENTKPGTVWNDISWWERQGEVVSVVPEVVTPDIYFDARIAIGVQARKTSGRFLIFQDQFDELVRELEALDEELLGADEERRTEIVDRRQVIAGDMGTLQVKITREARLILSIVETLTDIPRKLGLIIDRKEVGVYGTSEVVRKAIEKVKDARKHEEAIRALELVEEFLS